MEIFFDTISGSKTNKKESHLWHLKGKVDIPSFVQSQNGFGMAQHANFQIFQISRRFKVFCLTAQYSLVYIQVKLYLVKDLEPKQSKQFLYLQQSFVCGPQLSEVQSWKPKFFLFFLKLFSLCFCDCSILFITAILHVCCSSRFSCDFSRSKVFPDPTIAFKCFSI